MKYRCLATALPITLALSLLSLAGCDQAAPEPGKDRGGIGAGAKPTTKKAHPAPPAKPLTKELLDPSLNKLTAPDEFQVKFDTTKGSFTLEIIRDWAPHGADRMYNLVKIGFFEDIALFRAVKGFMVQFGIHGNPQAARPWSKATITGDPMQGSNKRGTISFAMAGSPDTRSTQMFINYIDNTRLDPMKFCPFGKVVDGMDVVDSFHQGYGETVTREQGNITNKGNGFLRKKYPELDYIKTAKLVEDAAPAGSASASAAPDSSAAPGPSAAPGASAAPKSAAPKGDVAPPKKGAPE
jgi:peptidyl-prolyl cis-trans isomerase A (cyclophilin A)